MVTSSIQRAFNYPPTGHARLLGRQELGTKPRNLSIMSIALSYPSLSDFQISGEAYPKIPRPGYKALERDNRCPWFLMVHGR